MTLLSLYLYQLVIIVSYNFRVNNKILGGLFCISWVALFAFRGKEYGLDIETYYNIFLDPDYYRLDEPLLVLINSLLSIASNDLFWFNLTYALLINVTLYYFFYKTSENFVICFILFSTSFLFYQFNLNIFRQGLANTLSVLFMVMFYRNKIYCSLLLLLPVFLHKSSVIFFLYFILSHFRINKNLVIFILISSLTPLIAILPKLLIEIASSIFPFLSNALTEYQRVSSNGEIGASSFNHRNIPVICSIFIVYLRWDSLDTKRGERILASMLVFSFLFATVFTGNVLLYDRLIIPAQLISVIFIVDYLKQKIRVYFPVVIMLLVIFSSLFTVLFWGPRNFLPEYEFLF
ncbi:EpsG family protein [Salinivibrio sp. VYel1]|uniref:EpsG family protein n=1 Tax=Salinivibrio sp. VYel1 TaxID=2490490 RepID=UPI00128E8CD3|nr:EpsG family protein [Salinivibrio sp. VYel1]MPX92115.1 EpsG family protein [Salinivibrio sp. VYel1]